MTVAPPRQLADPVASRRLLEALYLELTAELEQAEVAALAVGSDRSIEDEIDAGARASQQDQQFSLVSEIRGRREQVEAALGRVSDGTYGMCSACGEAIVVERLEAYPQATECVECKRARERRD